MAFGHLKRLSSLAALTAAALFMGHIAYAQSNDGPGSLGVDVGVVASIGNGIYIGEGVGVTYYPSLSYETELVTLSLLEGASVQLIQSGPLTFSVDLAPREHALSQSSTPELAGIERQETSADLGITASYDFSDALDLTLSTYSDVTGSSNGHEIDLSLNRVVYVGPLPLFLSASASWQDANLAAYTYGVRASEARAGRPAYAPGGIVTPSVSVSTGLPLSDNLLIFTEASAEFLSSAVTQSPIVDQSTSLGLLIGVNYSF